MHQEGWITYKTVFQYPSSLQSYFLLHNKLDQINVEPQQDYLVVSIRFSFFQFWWLSNHENYLPKSAVLISSLLQIS